MGQEMGASSEVRSVRSTAVAASRRLFGGFWADVGAVIACAFNATRGVTAITRAVAEALAGETLSGSGGFKGLDSYLKVEEVV